MQGFSATKLCQDGRKDCSDTDCQCIHPKDSVTTHFTFHKKPWDCSDGNHGTVLTDTCLGLSKEWYCMESAESWKIGGYCRKVTQQLQRVIAWTIINRLTGMVKQYLRWKSREMALWITLNILNTVMILERKDIIDW